MYRSGKSTLINQVNKPQLPILLLPEQPIAVDVIWSPFQPGSAKKRLDLGKFAVIPVGCSVSMDILPPPAQRKERDEDQPAQEHNRAE